MLRMRNLVLGLTTFMLLAGSFMAGRSTAQQQPMPVEQPAPFAFPTAWGDLHTVVPTAIGFAFVFQLAHRRDDPHSAGDRFRHRDDSDDSASVMP